MSLKPGLLFYADFKLALFKKSGWFVLNQQDANRSDVDEGEEGRIQLIISSEYPTEPFELCLFLCRRLFRLWLWRVRL